MSDYQKKLKDPRWQKKRLEVLNRDNWKCMLCGDVETTLHIHHKEYKAEPWEIDNSKLVTLCEHCHSLVEDAKPVSEYIQNVFKIVNGNTIIFCCILDTGSMLLIKTADNLKTHSQISFTKSEFRNIIRFYEDFKVSDEGKQE